MYFYLYQVLNAVGIYAKNYVKHINFKKKKQYKIVSFEEFKLAGENG